MQVPPRIFRHLHAEDDQEVFWRQGGNRRAGNTGWLAELPQPCKIKGAMEPLGCEAPMRVNHKQTLIVHKAGLPLEGALSLEALGEEQGGGAGKIPLVYPDVQTAELPECQVPINASSQHRSLIRES